MMEQERVAPVLVWRLDRLSRNLGDLILLADTFGKNDVGQHSFTEKIDLSSPWLQPILSVRKRVGAGRPVGSSPAGAGRGGSGGLRRERERAAGEASGPPSRRPAAARLTQLADRRRKLLDLYYAGAVDAELFARRRSSERSREWSIECRAERAGPGSHGCRGGSSPHQGA
jgi:hypothetical protein